jgi:hypothetical protein
MVRLNRGWQCAAVPAARATGIREASTFLKNDFASSQHRARIIESLKPSLQQNVQPIRIAPDGDSSFLQKTENRAAARIVHKEQEYTANS